MLPMHYLLSFIFKEPAAGYEKISLFSVFTGFVPILIIQTLSADQVQLKNVANIIQWVFFVFPHYCVFMALNNNFIAWSTYNLCAKVVENCKLAETAEQTCWSVACNLTSECCGKYNNARLFSD